MRFAARGTCIFAELLNVIYRHQGTLSEAAIARLNNAIDQLPDVADDAYRVTLDGDVEVVFKRAKAEAGQGRLSIQTGFGPEDFEFDLPELQSLFIKAFQVASDSLLKFFGRQADSETMNLIVLQWDPPKITYDRVTPQTVERAIEGPFRTVGLDLAVRIFVRGPDHDFRFVPRRQP